MFCKVWTIEVKLVQLWVLKYQIQICCQDVMCSTWKTVWFHSRRCFRCRSCRMFQVSTCMQCHRCPMAYPKAVWPPHVSHQFPQPGQSSGAQSSSGATGFVPFDPNAGSFPWWEVSEKPDDEIRNTESSYHLRSLRTRRRDGSVGLLVDPGAHDNLIGGLTAQQMCSE